MGWASEAAAARGVGMVPALMLGCSLVVSCSYDYSALTGHEDASPWATGGTRGASGARGGGGVLNAEAGGTGGGLVSSSGGGGQIVDAGDLGIGSGGAVGSGGLGTSTGGLTGGTGGDTPPASSGGLGVGGSLGTGGTTSGGGGVVGSGGAAGGGVAGTGVAASGGANGGANGGAGGGATDPDLVLWYKFDESSGTAAADSSGGHRDALIATTGLGGKAELSTVHQVGTHSVSLTGNGTLGGGVVVLPSINTLAPTAVTLAAWVYEASDVDWQRVFDFGSGYAGPQMFLTPREDKDSKHCVRFVITLLGSSSSTEQIVQSAQAISLNAWHHLAITLQSGSPYTGTLYVDGVAAGTNAAMTLHPAELGFTIQSYMGKSQFPTDPYMTGNIDDFRVYRRALKAAEIAALYAVR